MTHLPFQRRDLDLRVDYVVVGSGAGGATAAVTLARAGASVALVEAGAWRDPADYPSSTYGAMRDLFDDWGVTITRGRAFWPIVQARTVGGTTVINSAICVRTPEDIFRQWKREHGFGGNGFAERIWAYQDDIEADLYAEPVPARSAGRSNELALLGAQRAGYDSHVITRYAKGCEGRGQCLQGCRAERKQSTNLNYIPQIRRLGSYVVSSAPVHRVLFRARRAVGVAGRFVHPDTRQKGGTFELRARRAVIVAASATHSPALLQRSGVRSRALGKFFRAHPGTGVFGCYDEEVDMNRGATQGWASTAFRDEPGLKLETLSIPPEMVASRLAGGGQKLMQRLRDYRHIAMWCHAVRAESHGTVRNGLFGKPVVRYTLDRADMERFRQGMYILAKTHVAAGAKAIIPGIYGMPYQLKPDEIHVLKDAPLDPRRYIAILSHLFGGCVMGADSRQAVCDERGQVHDYENLFVADASIIPTNLGVNPQHTIMALARYVAEEAMA
ncbi:MAG: GMC family oxidoreductase [Myxococcota bacterium]